MEYKISPQLSDYLKDYRKKTITLDELSALFGGDVLYGEFALAVTKIINENILIPVKSSGLSSRTPRLPYKYRINSNIVREEYIYEIERIAMGLHPKISLNYYFNKSKALWESDREHILKIDRYLKFNGLPNHPAGEPERSYHIFGDEKFIGEKQGKRLLQRLGLYDDMKILTAFDPAMFFINSRNLSDNGRVHKHLIIENRTTFYSLSELLRGSELTSLIYGAGFNILASITAFEKQIDLEAAKHQYFYFGDLDYSGISIWHYASEKIDAIPAVAFYNGLLEQDAALGKEYQLPNKIALNNFISFFAPSEQWRIRETLDSGKYYPQEALSKQKLHSLFFAYFGEGVHGD